MRIINVYLIKNIHRVKKYKKKMKSNIVKTIRNVSPNSFLARKEGGIENFFVDSNINLFAMSSYKSVYDHSKIKFERLSKDDGKLLSKINF